MCRKYVSRDNQMKKKKKTPDLMKRLSLCQPLLAGANLLSHLAATTSIVTTSQATMLSWGRIQKERKIKRKPRVFARVVAAAGSTLLTESEGKDRRLHGAPPWLHGWENKSGGEDEEKKTRILLSVA